MPGSNKPHEHPLGCALAIRADVAWFRDVEPEALDSPIPCAIQPSGDISRDRGPAEAGLVQLEADVANVLERRVADIQSRRLAGGNAGEPRASMSGESYDLREFAMHVPRLLFTVAVVPWSLPRSPQVLTQDDCAEPDLHARQMSIRLQASVHRALWSGIALGYVF